MQNLAEIWRLMLRIYGSDFSFKIDVDEVAVDTAILAV